MAINGINKNNIMAFCEVDKYIKTHNRNFYLSNKKIIEED